MTGMNAGVVALFMCLAVPCYVLYLRLAERAPWPRLLRPALRCAGLALLVSLYWLVPAAMAGETGEAVAAFTERPEDVASTSSYSEVLRLLGFWVMYFQQDGRLAMPGSAAYLTNPLPLLASFLLPVTAAACALLARARARALAVLLLAVAVPVMVGLFPPAAPSPFGRLLSVAFDRVPGAIAFRTTNKAGALLALAYALLLGFGAAELFRAGPGRNARGGERRPSPWPRSWPSRSCPPGPGACIRSATGCPATGASWPPTSTPGATTPGSCSPPGPATPPTGGGWRGPTTSTCRCCRGPRWSGPPCPTARSSRPTSWPPSTSRSAVATPTRRWSRPGPVPGRGRGGGPQRPALGVLRRPRPSVVAERLAGDPSLDLVAAYGRPGEHTVAPVSDFYPPDQALEDAAVPPLQRYAVAGARPIVRTEPTRGAMLVDGDSFAVPSLVRLGLAPASRRSGCSAPSPRPSWPPRWPAGPGWWSPTATGGGPGAASAPARTTRRRSGPTSRCPPPP